jgi:acyl-CoA reductase-like NAD-dependent aldehyde dehydrogenase
MSVSVQEISPGSATPGSVAPVPDKSVLGKVRSDVLDRLVGRIALGPGAHSTLSVRAPFTDEAIREVPLATPADVEQAVKRARVAQKDWAALSIKDRAQVFLRFHDRLLQRQAEVLDVIQLESGKARKHAFEEVADTAIVSRYYALHAQDHLSPKRRKGALPGLTATTERHPPLGVVGLIAPWNYPLTLSITDAIPALMAGNAVVLKPDQQTPFTALWGVDLLIECGLPSALFQVVTGRGRDLGTPLINAVDFIGFTGSTPTGRAIAQKAGERLIGCSLELGGKNPMLVLDDANLERACDGAVRGCFANAGQLCISIERLYVHASLYDAFLSRFAQRTRALKLGSSFDYECDMGSLVSHEQLEKVELHVNDAVKKGATAAAGGKARPDLGPLFYEPTVLVNVTEGMDLFAQETFGPVVSIYKFESVEEAIEKANATRYGLNASIWTEDLDLGARVAARIQAGTVNVNEAYAATWASVDAPMGGFKDSGLGRRHGAQGILKYTEAQTISVQHLLPIAAPAGVSERQFSQVMSGALRVLRRIPGVR